MSHYETENRAIKFVIAQEDAAGRVAEDVRNVPGSKVDVVSRDSPGTTENFQVDLRGIVEIL
ncbi:hypothetical protein [Brachybacterium sp. AOP29-B2-41]|uniref:hypothetical protein n=1 Tax=Brachybacterium sp. AOP29-B2-41 TaxID=3457704 RepID=UPI004033CF20